MAKEKRISPGRVPGQDRSLAVMRYIAYVMVFFGLYLLQSTPGLLAVFGIKPNLLLAAAVCFAMVEGEFVGGLYGALAGALIDLANDGIFGFHALLLCVLCTLVGLGVIYLLQLSSGNALLLTAAVLLLCELLHYYFRYSIWNYDGSWRILLEDTLPGCLYTLILTPLLFYGIRHLCAGLHSRGER